MLKRALPEGVLPPGGSAQGFVFFPRVSEETQEGARLVFEVELVNPDTGAKLTTAAVPLIVEG